MEALILAIALNANVSPDLLLAVCYQETKLVNIDTRNDGKSTSYGPCQTKKIASRQVAMDHLDITEPRNSIEIAAKYLKYGINKCGGIRSGLAFYNSGKCIDRPKRGGYTDKVLAHYNDYKLKRRIE
jgi:hypothetical protein